jgi:oligopeptide transport system ATP-binding protein
VSLSIAGMSAPILKVSELSVRYASRAVVDRVSFDLSAGETLSLVGESGSGKSSLARAVLRLIEAADGKVEWLGEDLLTCSPAQLRAKRRDLQMVFQDPLASLNPRMSVGDSISEPLKIFEPRMDATQRQRRVADMLQRVGLDAAMAGRYPHEFSGGQCQRIGIARAMMLNPKLLICDEAVSSLDVSIQGQIINLLLDLQHETGMAMLFISHNLAVVRHLSRRVMVMFRGRLVEIASRDSLFNGPVHPYTRALLNAAALNNPVEPPVDSVAGSAGSAGSGGCAYRDRCRYALPLCAATEPPLELIAPGLQVACHRAGEPRFRYS